MSASQDLKQAGGGVVEPGFTAGPWLRSGVRRKIDEIEAEGI